MATRKLPTKKKIRQYWCERLWEGKGYDSPSEFLNDNLCFACGFDNPFDWSLESAHILARVWGGDDTEENIHLLCHICHTDSENLSGEKYWDWFWKRNSIDMLFSCAAQNGFSMSSLLVCVP